MEKQLLEILKEFKSKLKSLNVDEVGGLDVEGMIDNIESDIFDLECEEEDEDDFDINEDDFDERRNVLS